LLEQRLDKWLWCARLAKTRSGAARLIADGKVRINGERALTPSRHIHPGDVVTTAHSGRLAVVRVIDVSERRGPASLAQTLYEDLTPEAAPAADTPLGPQRPGKRPTKRDRRRLDAFRGGDA
jgi:ribosome-associated heat shock protein Hsp15